MTLMIIKVKAKSIFAVLNICHCDFPYIVCAQGGCQWNPAVRRKLFNHLFILIRDIVREDLLVLHHLNVDAPHRLFNLFLAFAFSNFWIAEIKDDH